jgi:hypothetical protein
MKGTAAVTMPTMAAVVTNAQLVLLLPPQAGLLLAAAGGPLHVPVRLPQLRVAAGAAHTQLQKQTAAVRMTTEGCALLVLSALITPLDVCFCESRQTISVRASIVLFDSLVVADILATTNHVPIHREIPYREI